MAKNFMAVMDAITVLQPVKDILADVLIIDCHAHIGPHSRYFVPDDDIDGIIAVMDDMGIDKIGINKLEALEGDFIAGNDQTAEALRKYPDRIIGHACINPNYPELVEPETLRCFEELGMRMLKFHAAWHNTEPMHVNYRPAIEYCAARKIPLIAHLPDYVGSLPAYVQLAQQYPEMPFVVAHSTAPWAIDAIVEQCAHVENIYFDTCGYSKWYSSVERLVNGCGEDRVLYGSDVAWLNLPHEIGPILFAELSDAAKEKVLGLNMQGILERIDL